MDGVTGVTLAVGDLGGISGGSGGFDEVLGLRLGACENGQDFQILAIGKIGCFGGQLDTKVNVSKPLLIGADESKCVVAEGGG